MLLTIKDKDTLDNLLFASGQADKSLLFIIIGTILIGFIAFLLFRRKKKILTSIINNPGRIKSNENTPSPSTSTRNSIYPESTKMHEEIKGITEEQALSSKNQINIENLITKIQIYVEKDQFIVPPIPEPISNIPENEEPSREKYIGYNPINILAQTEPLNYPYVVMPKPGCVIKFPRKGRSGRKGYKEDAFQIFIEKYFKSNFQIFDDRFILVKNNPKPYEPDFSLIDEKEGINIFLDVEIDEPYEGLNDLNRRKATHYQFSDNNRNNVF